MQHEPNLTWPVPGLRLIETCRLNPRSLRSGGNVQRGCGYRIDSQRAAEEIIPVSAATADSTVTAVP